MITGCMGYDFRCEGQHNPLAIGSELPAFSWKFSQQGLNKKQTAYRIIIYYEQYGSKVFVWDTGKVCSPSTCMIQYMGERLKSRTRYYWQVCLWDADDYRGDSSETYWFETGLFERSEWGGVWIGGNSLVRRDFKLNHTVLKARAYIACIGYYELKINGRKVGDQVLAPSHTDFDKSIEYNVYDIFDYLDNGENTVGAMLGHGFTSIWPLTKQKPQILIRLEIHCNNGEVITITSDEFWQCSDGPILSDSVYDGEIYDARIDREGWDSPGYDGRNWGSVKLFSEPSGKLMPQAIPPIRVTEEIKPVLIKLVSEGTYLVDIGQNITGWLRLTFNGASGTRVTMKYAEVINEQGEIDQRNLRSAKAADCYYLKGRGEEIFEPGFTYHGFRYVQISNYPGELTDEKIIARVVHSDVENISHFRCSDELLNKIHSAMRWTLRTNLHSIPTDCPQRDERWGWLADGQLASDACIFNFYMHNFYKKWLNDMRDLQDKDTGMVEFGQAPGKIKWKGILWPMAYIIMPWNIYIHYGDRNILTEYYAGMKEFFEYMSCNEEEGLLTFEEECGDWLCIEDTKAPQVRDGYYYYCAKIMADTAEVTGFEEDAVYFRNKAMKIADSYNKRYYNPQSYPPAGYYNALAYISQFGQALPLWLGIVPEGEKEKVLGNLLWDINEARGETQLTTGILGTKHLIETLSMFGRNDVVYKLFKRTRYPSWGFMLDMGATTIWERWKFMTGYEMNSHNHPVLAAVDPWFIRELAGINRHYTNREGRREFLIKPYFCEELSFVQAEMETNWGEVSVSWEHIDNGLKITIAVPSNTMANIQLQLPNGNRFTMIKDSLGNGFDDMPQMNSNGFSSVEIKVGSGKRHFKMLVI